MVTLSLAASQEVRSRSMYDRTLRPESAFHADSRIEGCATRAVLVSTPQRFPRGKRNLSLDCAEPGRNRGVRDPRDRSGFSLRPTEVSLPALSRWCTVGGRYPSSYGTGRIRPHANWSTN